MMEENTYKKTIHQLQELERKGQLHKKVSYTNPDDVLDVVAKVAMRLVEGQDTIDGWIASFHRWQELEATPSSAPPGSLEAIIGHQSDDPFTRRPDHLAYMRERFGTDDVRVPRVTLASSVRVRHFYIVMRAFHRLRRDLRAGTVTVGTLYGYVGAFAVLFAYGKRAYMDTPVEGFAGGNVDTPVPLSWQDTLTFLARAEEYKLAVA
jgi:hypothetical protein